MFGPDEHRGMISNIGGLEQEANALLSKVRHLRLRAFESDPSATQDCRDFLRYAVQDLGNVLAALDNAKHALPQPQTVMFPGWE